MTDELAIAAVPKAVLDALNRIFMERYHSLAEYIVEASPFVAPGHERILERVKTIAAFDRAESERLASVIESLGAVPHVGPYPRRLAELNYLSIQYLRQYLCEQLLRQIDDYTAVLPSMRKYPDARDEVTSVINSLREFVSILNA